MTHTMKSILDMIYSVPNETRMKASFVCDPETAETLRFVFDDDGRCLWRGSPTKQGTPYLLGYPVYADKRRAGLAFGEFSPLPEPFDYHTKAGYGA